MPEMIAVQLVTGDFFAVDIQLQDFWWHRGNSSSPGSADRPRRYVERHMRSEGLAIHRCELQCIFESSAETAFGARSADGPRIVRARIQNTLVPWICCGGTDAGLWA